MDRNTQFIHREWHEEICPWKQKGQHQEERGITAIIQLSEDKIESEVLGVGVSSV